MRLSIESLRSGLLGSCFGSWSLGFGGARGLGRRTDGKVLIRCILDGDMMRSLCVLLHELLSSGELVGGSFGSHCKRGLLFRTV
jgi:hypothetical protein